MSFKINQTPSQPPPPTTALKKKKDIINPPPPPTEPPPRNTVTRRIKPAYQLPSSQTQSDDTTHTSTKAKKTPNERAQKVLKNAEKRFSDLLERLGDLEKR